MTGTIVSPSGEVIPDISRAVNVEGQEATVYKCSRCNELISLGSDQDIENVCHIAQGHSGSCVPPANFRELSGDIPVTDTIITLDLLMPLQPRRTWSAEDERRRRLEEDPDAYDVGPHSVTCRGCHRPIRLNATGRYYAANWNKHKMGCKSTNNVDGGNAALESKFTGRVAAFRVSGTAQMNDPFTYEPISYGATPASASGEESEIPQNLKLTSANTYMSKGIEPYSYDPHKDRISGQYNTIKGQSSRQTLETMGKARSTHSAPLGRDISHAHSATPDSSHQQRNSLSSKYTGSPSISHSGIKQDDTIERERRFGQEDNLSSASLSHHSPAGLRRVADDTFGRTRGPNPAEHEVLAPLRSPASRTLHISSYSSSAEPVYKRSSSGGPQIGLHTSNSSRNESLPSLSSLTRTLPPPSATRSPYMNIERCSSVPPIAPQVRDRRELDFSSPRDRPGSSSSINDVVLPPIRMYPPQGSPMSIKHHLDDEDQVDWDRSSPPRPRATVGANSWGTARTPFQHQVPPRASRPSSSHSATSLSTSFSRSIRVASNPENVIHEENIVSSPLPSKKSLEENEDDAEMAARLHPVWKWEKGNSVGRSLSGVSDAPERTGGVTSISNSHPQS